jgi:hypothetical protein
MNFDESTGDPFLSESQDHKSLVEESTGTQESNVTIKRTRNNVFVIKRKDVVINNQSTESAPMNSNISSQDSEIDIDDESFLYSSPGLSTPSSSQIKEQMLTPVNTVESLRNFPKGKKQSRKEMLLKQQLDLLYSLDGDDDDDDDKGMKKDRNEDDNFENLLQERKARIDRAKEFEELKQQEREEKQKMNELEREKYEKLEEKKAREREKERERKRQRKIQERKEKQVLEDQAKKWIDKKKRIDSKNNNNAYNASHMDRKCEEESDDLGWLDSDGSDNDDELDRGGNGFKNSVNNDSNNNNSGDIGGDSFNIEGKFHLTRLKKSEFGEFEKAHHLLIERKKRKEKEIEKQIHEYIQIKLIKMTLNIIYPIQSKPSPHHFKIRNNNNSISINAMILLPPLLLLLLLLLILLLL